MRGLRISLTPKLSGLPSDGVLGVAREEASMAKVPGRGQTTLAARPHLEGTAAEDDVAGPAPRAAMYGLPCTKYEELGEEASGVFVVDQLQQPEGSGGRVQIQAASGLRPRRSPALQNPPTLPSAGHRNPVRSQGLR